MRQRIHGGGGGGGDKMIPDSAKPCLKSFYPPFAAGIVISHQSVADSYCLLFTYFLNKFYKIFTFYFSMISWLFISKHN